MLTLLCYVVLASSAPFGQVQSKPAEDTKPKLPSGAEEWDLVGAFRLTDNKGAEFKVYVYAEDSNVIFAKRAKDGLELKTYPNTLTLHAMYRSSDGEWSHTELMTAGSSSFSKVIKETPEAVTIQLRSNIRVSRKPGESLEAYLDRTKGVNEPVIKSLRVNDGKPKLK